MQNYIQLVFAIILFVLGSHNVLAQSIEQKEKLTSKVNEIRLNIAGSLLSYPEITYERLLSNRTGVGLSVSFALNPSNSYDFNTRYAINPYYRFYFGKQKANGFFLEGDLIFSMDLNDEYTYNSSRFGPSERVILYEKQNRLSIGTSTGVKVINQNDWQLNLSFGLAVSIINKWVHRYEREIIWLPILKIAVGKRI